MRDYLCDLKVGARQFFKEPGGLLFAVMAYSIGLGLVALMLTLILGVSRAKPDYEEIDRLYTLRWDPATEHLWKNGNQFPDWRIFTYEDFANEQTSFENMTAVRTANFNVMLDGEVQRLSGLSATTGFFDTLGVKPHIGRLFSGTDVGSEAQRVVVISHALWQREFQGDPDVVGSDLTVNGSSYAVIGVAQKGFDFISESEIWVPYVKAVEERRGVGHGHLVVASLKPEVSLAAAKSEFDELAKRFEAMYPDTNTGFISVSIGRLADIFFDDNTRRLFDVAMMCSALVLLIACANVANLQSSRMILRTKELAVRSSLGATRGRLVAQLLVEGLFIAFLGGLGGWLIGELATTGVYNFVVTAENVSIPSWMSMELDWRVLLILFAVTLLASVIAGLPPALRASRTDVNEVLKDQSRTSSSLSIGMISKALVFLQLSFSLGLLIAAGSMVKTVKSAQNFDPPYDTDLMLIGRIDLSGDNYSENTAKMAFYDRLQERLEAIPGVRAAGFTSSFDMMYNWDSVMAVEGTEYARREDYPRMRNEIVNNDYFEQLGIPILQGRGFTDLDAEGTEGVIVVNTVLAETYWPGESPIGKRLKDVWDEENPWMTVVGLIPDTEMLGPGTQDEASRAGFYQPLRQRSWLGSPTVFLYCERDPLNFVTALRRAVLDLDPSLSVYRVKTVSDAVQDNIFGLYFFRNIFGLFGIGSLLLASVGVYGVMAFSVNQRINEYGIRRAVGAKAADIVSLVFRRGAAQVLSGIVFGTAFGYLLLIVLRQGIDVVDSDAFTYAVPIAFLTFVSVVALSIPSAKMLRIQLSNTLRSE